MYLSIGHYKSVATRAIGHFNRESLNKIATVSMEKRTEYQKHT